MRVKDRQLCEAVLSPGKEIGRLSWVKVIRDGSLLLALPLNRRLALATLDLYQPQRGKGRLFRSVLRACVMLGVYRLLPRFELTLGDRGVFSGLDHDARLKGFGFLLGNAASPMRNLIGLYGSEGSLKVVKVGCGDAAQVVRDECASMRNFCRLVVGVPECQGLFDIENGAAYVAELVSGRSPRGAGDDALVFALLEKWLQAGQSKEVSELDCWKALNAKLSDDVRQRFAALAQANVTSPVVHGDLAPWNIKISAGAEVKVLDWEFAQQAGMPGWDWFHYHVQRLKLVDDASAEKIIESCRAMLGSEPMRVYLKKAGLSSQGDLLLGAYLYCSGMVYDYPREDLIEYWTSTHQVAS